jgi:hypothetical protein
LRWRVSIRFKDNTDLTVVIDTALTFQSEYSEWKAGNQKVLKLSCPAG